MGWEFLSVISLKKKVNHFDLFPEVCVYRRLFRQQQRFTKYFIIAGKQWQLSDKQKQSNGTQSDDSEQDYKQIKVDEQNNMLAYLALMQGDWRPV